jgi:hypothetical protein
VSESRLQQTIRDSFDKYVHLGGMSLILDQCHRVTDPGGLISTWKYLSGDIDAADECLTMTHALSCHDMQ